MKFILGDIRTIQKYSITVINNHEPTNYLTNENTVRSAEGRSVRANERMSWDREITLRERGNKKIKEVYAFFIL